MRLEDGKARYVMIGGFLGSGKTTAVDRLAEHLTSQGLRVGLITNDQSTGLVDTALLRSRGYAVEEIAGGCFCCRFPSLQEAAERLADDASPDVFLAEPVGSCTDLLATVSYPLRRIYGNRFTVAPLSVLVDPVRAARIFGLAEGRSFSDKVVYVYEKQLEEADYIVVNKCDLIDASAQERLAGTLAERFPRATVLRVSAKDGTGVLPWFARLLEGEARIHPTMQLDYRLYAEGEAELGWLNATFVVRPEATLDANGLLLRLTEALRSRIAATQGELAHLKMTFDPDEADGLLSVVSVTRGDGEPDLRESLLDRVSGGSLVVNLRASLPPEELSGLVRNAIHGEASAHPDWIITSEHEESFRPAPPVPTHRISIPDPAASAAEAP